MMQFKTHCQYCTALLDDEDATFIHEVNFHPESFEGLAKPIFAVVCPRGCSPAFEWWHEFIAHVREKHGGRI